MRISLRFAGAAVIGFLALGAIAAEPRVPKFDFGSGSPAADATAVGTDAVYATGRSFGFEPGATLTSVAGGITSSEPFFFSAAVAAEGNYRVTVRFAGSADATVKAELRRLMVERVRTAAGEVAERSFIVNTRTPKIASVAEIREGVVRLKAPRETTQEAWAWDNLITLEFNGPRPVIAGVTIEPVNVPTIFLLGDSTVCDQSKEPFNSWGQMFTRWFKPEVAIANHGESGETYRDSIGRRRLDKILSLMKPGDWLLMQFGHNDQKQIATNSGGPFTTYRQEIKQHIDGVRSRGGFVAIVSPMERRGFDDAGQVRASLADYAKASADAAREFGVPFIDLNAMSTTLYAALGPEKSAVAFATSNGRVDNTHHNNYGSYELAKCVVQAIREQKLPIARFIVDAFTGFDPARPDNPAAFAVPASGAFTNQRPLGDETNP